jgi:hypothetical protein
MYTLEQEETLGTVLLAKCACGFEVETTVGAGRFTHRTICNFPCMCKRCQNMVTANLLASPPVCPDCGSTDIVPYDQPELIGALGPLTQASWSVRDSLGRDLVLTNGRYRCPKCADMSLSFSATGLFD